MATELGFGEDKARAERVLRCTLRVLRKRVAPQEYLDFIAQLPICIQAEAIQGWKLSLFPDKSIKHLDDFAKGVMEEDSRVAYHDFEDPDKAKSILRALFRFLKKHVSEGEMKELADNLPEDIKEFILKA